ncbi:hypothetical protein [Mycobacterium pseudokansasii]|uniref:hypothetical protein n=1 Tax=Mycobacterium pseudokansasii TaxID=2341080 RepID=UPI000F18E029|nr:hypothetical protein [Mycobacterium pseudokansasii]VAZ95977.1 hypothetical protein LAUMK35_03183 [Mycobacterium pseudokansasii]VAZ97305.1 hypothetical protein LAUMK21_03182 [Mycobacterium pseudokansasii]
MDVVLRVVAVPIVAVALGGLPVGGPALADPAATRVITAVAVGSDGQPVNGYREAPAQGNVTAVDNCTTPSPSAVADNIYYCSPSAANAGTCWPSTPESLLCVDNPWDKRLHRVTYGGPLPLLHPIATPDPFALALDDGTHCLLRNGGAWGGRDDGYVGVYGCGAPDANLAVLWLPSQGAGTCVDRSAPVWTVRVGRLGTPGEHFPPPQTRAVATAWFAGN